MANMEEACPIRLLHHARKVLASRLGRLPDVIRSDWPLERGKILGRGRGGN